MRIFELDEAVGSWRVQGVCFIQGKQVYVCAVSLDQGGNLILPAETKSVRINCKPHHTHMNSTCNRFHNNNPCGYNYKTKVIYKIVVMACIFNTAF